MVMQKIEDIPERLEAAPLAADALAETLGAPELGR
jgi:hypothetical protein